MSGAKDGGVKNVIYMFRVFVGRTLKSEQNQRILVRLVLIKDANGPQLSSWIRV